ncbi:MAG: D-alanyl-D-alanine carboxypeptidase [Erysipelothrix sp.]|nr:D-alanyl-D-alanine carboxypeptidase [Erysipelothrix sp.]
MLKDKKMKTIKIILTLIIATILFTSIYAVKNENIEPSFYVYNTIVEYDSQSNYALVINRENKKVKYDKNSETKAYPASLTKLMTVLVAIENIEDMEALVSIDVDSYYEMIEQDSSMAGFYPNEQVSYWDLLHGTMLSSGGEATNSLAIGISKTQAEFVKLMNKKAKDLGMFNTNFTNVEGLHNDNQYSTAQDMVKLLDIALENPVFREIITTITHQTISTDQHPEGIELTSVIIKYLDTFNNGEYKIIGGKPGYTPEAGINLAVIGIKNGVEYISVLMNAPINEYSKRFEIFSVDTIEIFERLNESTDK